MSQIRVVRCVMCRDGDDLAYLAFRQGTASILGQRNARDQRYALAIRIDRQAARGEPNVWGAAFVFQCDQAWGRDLGGSSLLAAMAVRE